MGVVGEVGSRLVALEVLVEPGLRDAVRAVREEPRAATG